MHITKALLIQFLEDKCSREESELVYQFLLKNQHVLDELLKDEEWERFELVDRRFQPETSKAWWTYIRNRIKYKVN
jgi:transmembrane sensor